MKKKILFVEICNYKDYPIGGYLAFAKQMVTAFGDELVLVGMSTDNTPVGEWTMKEIDGYSFEFFSVLKVKHSHKKSIIPGRLKSYLAVRKYREVIMQKKFDNVFIQTPEVLFALSKYRLENLCTRIPGVENPMSISRYWYGKYFAKVFDLFYFKALNKSNVILASADNAAIHDFILRGKGKLQKNRVVQFPTRVNTEIFKPLNRQLCRKQLNLSQTSKIVITSGRLSTLKGWELLLESFIEFRMKFPDALFIFAGDGEDRFKIESFILENKLEDHVLLIGRINHEMLSYYLNAADLFVMGSYVEGWSTSLVEAIACAKPIVCTSFSSASELILEKNGYIITERDKISFSRAMFKAMEIPRENLMIRASEMDEFASKRLKNDILEHWKLV